MFDGKYPLVLGPCVIEGEDHTLYCAKKIKEMTENLPFFVFF